MGRTVEGSAAAQRAVNGKTPRRRIPIRDDLGTPAAGHALDEPGSVAGLLRRLRWLERELAMARARLGALVNEQEQLVSVNEELYAVNTECRAKLAELTELQRDHDHLLGALDFGVLFLDERVNVRRFNSEAARALPLNLEHVGRHLSEVARSSQHAPLVREAERVLATAARRLLDISDVDGARWTCELRRMRGCLAQGALGVLVTLRPL